MLPEMIHLRNNGIQKVLKKGKIQQGLKKILRKGKTQNGGEYDTFLAAIGNASTQCCGSGIWDPVPF